MMIGKIIDNKLFKSKVIAEVYINNTSQEELDISVVVVKREKQNLEIINTFHGISSLDQFFELVPIKIPLSLIIDGKGVIQKAVKTKEDTLAIYQVLPNAQHQKFIWSQAPLSQEGYVQVAVARKEFITESVERFSEMGYLVVDISIGPMVLANIASLLPKDSKEVRVKNYKIDYTSQGIFSVTKNGVDEASYKIQIGKDEISNVDLIPFAASVKYFQGTHQSNESLSQICRPSKEQFLFKRIFNALLIGSCGLLFLILLVNFLLFDHYSKFFTHYEKEYLVNKELLDRLSYLEEEFLLQKTFIEDNASRGFSQYAFFSDRLAHLLPSSLSLTELSFDPVLESIKEDREIRSTKGIIIVSGQTSQSLQLNQYINVIESEPWTKDVTLLEYQSQMGKRGEFSIEIALNTSFQ